MDGVVTRITAIVIIHYVYFIDTSLYINLIKIINTTKFYVLSKPVNSALQHGTIYPEDYSQQTPKTSIHEISVQHSFIHQQS